MTSSAPGAGRTIGVLAPQGAFARHQAMLESLGAETVAVRRAAHLVGIDGLVIPGGESTTMSMLLERGDLFAPIADAIAGGLPTFGTCAGMILLASEVLDGRADQRAFSAIDITVRRNAYGRQVDSFDGTVSLAPELGGADGPLPASFIRAPQVVRVGDAVEVLGRADGEPVLVRQSWVMAAAFHPELGVDARVHRHFLALHPGA